MKRFKTFSLLMLGFCLALLGAWMAAASLEPASLFPPVQASDAEGVDLQMKPEGLLEGPEACLTSGFTSSDGAGDLLGLIGASQAQCCIDQCHKDRHCDDFCGAPGAGVCIQLNSCCRECACLF